MPKRRLHGETQKRRKKPSTQLLKRQASIVRVSSTLKPAPFEHSTHPGREDLEFQEAMREMDVRRSPWSGESTERRKKVESVQFLAGVEEEGQFQQKMAEWGVRPLDGEDKKRAGSRTQNSGAQPPAPGASTGAQSRAEPGTGVPRNYREHQGAGDTGSVLPGKAGEELPIASGGTPQNSKTETPPPEGVKPAGGGEPKAPPGKSGKSSSTTFQLEEEGGDMAALLEKIPFDPEMKFEGGQPPSSDHREPHGNFNSRVLHPEATPDSELDLHGKTLEEAIAMVQNFLLVSHEQRLRSVLIITGKGHNSGEGGPVLKQAVYRWLERNGERFARDFHHAPARLGGEGAIWVTLR